MGTDAPRAPKAWTYQDEFLRQAGRLTARFYARLGVEPGPSLGLVAVAASEPDESEREEYPPVSFRSPELGWHPRPDEWERLIRAESRRVVLRATPALWTTRQSSRSLAFERVIERQIRAHDRRAKALSFATRAAPVGGYIAIIVLEFERTVYRAFPRALPRRAKGQGRVEVGLLDACTFALRERLFEELARRDLGMRWRAARRDVDDLLRDAGDELLSRVQQAVLPAEQPGNNLFEQLNAIASLPYEGEEAQGGMLLGRPPEDAAAELVFREPVPLGEPVWVRKMLEMAEGQVVLLSDTERVLGLTLYPGAHEPRTTEFLVTFQGQQRWRLSYGERTLSETHFGVPSLPTPRLERRAFEEVFRRVFPDASDEGAPRIWRLVAGALEARHGTMVVVAGEAASEAERLAGQATRIEPRSLGALSARRAVAIDGSLLVDTEGVCHAIGAILDGHGTGRGSPSRGARFNSAVRYVTGGTSRLAVVVSEDGHVDLFPRLRPPIRRERLAELIGSVRAYLDRPMPDEVREIGAHLARYYLEYVPADCQGKVRWCAEAGFSEETGVGEFDAHPSDFLD